MNRRVSLMLAGLLVGAMLTTAALAEDVCVTKNGKRYHKMNSRFLKGKQFDVISREEAEKRGYKPSSEFFRDDAAGKQGTNPAEPGAVKADQKVNKDKK
jgi:hypothetical protein